MFLIWTHTHLCITHGRERKISLLGEGALVWGLIFVLLIHLYRGSFARFSSPWGFPRINLCVLLCGCACLSFSDPLAYGYDVMMLKVLRSCITIKSLTKGRFPVWKSKSTSTLPPNQIQWYIRLGCVPLRSHVAQTVCNVFICIVGFDDKRSTGFEIDTYSIKIYF